RFSRDWSSDVCSSDLAGRTKKRGKVIIQSYDPGHRILQQVTAHDYMEMFEEQLYEREQYQYPPSNRIIRITFKHKDYNKLNEAEIGRASCRETGCRWM